MGAGVEPGVAALHHLQIELALSHIGLVDGGDFKLTEGAGLDGFGDINHLVVIEVQACNGVVAFGLASLLFDADGFAIGVKLHHAIAFGVTYVISKDGGACSLRVCAFQQWGKVMAMKNVVTQDQSTWCVAYELLTQDKGLRQPVWAGLHGIFQVHAPLGAVA